MTFTFTPVTDRSLLPYGTATGVRAGATGSTATLSLIPTFEAGIRLGDLNFDLVRVAHGESVQLGISPGGAGPGSGTEPVWGYDLTPLAFAFSGTALRGEVWVDRNLERDSLVVTWVKAEGNVRYWEWWAGSTARSSAIEDKQTWQIELRDRGAGQIEVIYRFSDLDYIGQTSSFATPFYPRRIGMTLADGLPGGLEGRDVANWDMLTGNTGVAGVWQYRILNGVVERVGNPPEDLRLIGTAGNDSLTGGLGRDRLNGGAGDDELIAGASRGDVLYGGAGDDFLQGGTLGFAEVVGAEGNDRIIIYGRSNMVGGGAGDDVITLVNSFSGNRIYGGAGNDEIILARHDGSAADLHTPDLIYGGAGDDLIRSSVLYVHGWGEDPARPILYGGEGNDTIVGARFFHGVFHGDEGDDVLHSGNSSGAEMFGGAGDDFLMAKATLDDEHFSSVQLGRVIAATGGAGADRFSTGIGRWGQLGLTIRDFNPDEGDVLVLDGGWVAPEDLFLRINQTRILLSDFTGWEDPITQLSLHWRRAAGPNMLFNFTNAQELDRLELRLFGPSGVEHLTIDLLA